jgi:hypothetical protein
MDLDLVGMGDVAAELAAALTAWGFDGEGQGDEQQ